MQLRGLLFLTDLDNAYFYMISLGKVDDYSCFLYLLVLIKSNSLEQNFKIQSEADIKGVLLLLPWLL